MHVGDRYLRYLNHLGSTVSVRDLAGSSVRDLVALRHDVDHDLDIALEMAYWEHEVGARSTYFLLHTAPYWDAPDLVDKALQLQDFGHEVGVHVNVLTQWVRGDTDDPAGSLGAVLGRLRAGGVDVVGVSAHGDPLCYQHGYINYWCFRDLRPSDPEAHESGRSAEGLHVDDPRFRVEYPGDHRLHRPDGAALDLWQVDMASLGLEYDAMHVPVDRYFTDSGGTWTRSPDPLEHDLSRGRHQVLMHPLYWREDQQRLFFFLSTARSGSTWLATVLDRATPLTARHELSLNHLVEDGRLVPEKATDRFASLTADGQRVRNLLVQARLWVEGVDTDYAEANVYLVHVLDELRAVFPEAQLVHLHREPADVVRSILNRDWYDTPLDERHPAMDVEEWERLSQVDKACWYVRRTNEILLELHLPRLPLEVVSADPSTLADALRPLGVAFFPRLAAAVFSEHVNAGRSDVVGPLDTWPAADRASAASILEPIRADLGYLGRRAPGYWRGMIRRARRQGRTRQRSEATEARPEPLLDEAVGDLALHVVGGTVAGPGAFTPDRDRHLSIVVGGSRWRGCTDDEGWEVQPGTWVDGRLHYEIEGPGDVRLFALQYGQDGGLLVQRPVGALDGASTELRFAFAPRPDAARFALGVFSPLDALPDRVALTYLRLERRLKAAPPAGARTRRR